MRVEEKNVSGFNTKLIFMGNTIVGIATDIGPRILYFASAEKPDFNLFGIIPDFGADTVEGFWRIYGGHRFWSCPEVMPRSYPIDDKPVKINIDGKRVVLYGNPEIENSIQKEIEIIPLTEKSIQVTHKLKNIGRWPIKLGCWALSVMRKSGFAIIPLKAEKKGLLPDRQVIFWPYTDVSDKRLVLENEYIFVKQDPDAKSFFKIGTMAGFPWIAYWVEGFVFVKKFSPVEGEYPDFGCSVETFTNSDFLELETLGPLKEVKPSLSISHTETWSISEIGKLNLETKDVKEKLEEFTTEEIPG